MVAKRQRGGADRRGCAAESRAGVGEPSRDEKRRKEVAITEQSRIEIGVGTADNNVYQVRMI